MSDDALRFVDETKQTQDTYSFLKPIGIRKLRKQINTKEFKKNYFVIDTRKEQPLVVHYDPNNHVRTPLSAGSTSITNSFSSVGSSSINNPNNSINYSSLLASQNNTINNSDMENAYYLQQLYSSSFSNPQQQPFISNGRPLSYNGSSQNNKRVQFRTANQQLQQQQARSSYPQQQPLLVNGGAFTNDNSTQLITNNNESSSLTTHHLNSRRTLSMPEFLANYSPSQLQLDCDGGQLFIDEEQVQHLLLGMDTPSPSSTLNECTMMMNNATSTPKSSTSGSSGGSGGGDADQQTSPSSVTRKSSSIMDECSNSHYTANSGSSTSIDQPMNDCIVTTDDSGPFISAAASFLTPHGGEELIENQPPEQPTTTTLYQPLQELMMGRQTIRHHQLMNKHFSMNDIGKYANAQDFALFNSTLNILETLQMACNAQSNLVPTEVPMVQDTVIDKMQQCETSDDVLSRNSSNDALRNESPQTPNTVDSTIETTNTNLNPNTADIGSNASTGTINQLHEEQHSNVQNSSMDPHTLTEAEYNLLEDEDELFSSTSENLFSDEYLYEE